MRRTKSLLFLSTLFLISNCSAPKTNNRITEQFNSAIEQSEILALETMEAGQFPGMAVAVSWKGNLVYLKGFGYSNIEEEVYIKPSESQFRVGSISKPFTSAALAKLYEQGKVELDAPIQQYVPDFPEKKYTITLKQLTGHLAGIRHYRGAEFLSNKFYATVDEGLIIFKDDPLLFEPGTKYAYSSYGWNLVSAAIKNISETPFLEYMEKTVFKPLKMDQAEADYANQNMPNRVSFYELVDDKVQLAPKVDNSYKWAGGGFIATAVDVVKFAQAHAKPGFLDQNTLNLWIASQKTTSGKPTNYGIGWRSGTTPAGNDWYGHSGGSVGGTSMMAIYPDQDLVVVTLVNLSGAKMNNLAHNIADLFIDTASTLD